VGNDKSPASPKDVYTFEAPEIKSLSLTELPLDVVKPVTISGSNFEGASDVIGICDPGGTLPHHNHPFDAIHAANSSTITTTTSPFMDIRISTDSCEKGGPAEAKYPFDVRVAVGNAYSPSVTADEFTFDGPVIDTVTSTEKPYLDAGVPITVTGTGLDKVNEIVVRNPDTYDSASHIGGDDFVTHTSTKIVFRAPDDVSTTLGEPSTPFTQIRYSVETRVFVGYAVDPGRTANFDFLGPVVTGVTPTSGPLKGGSKVTINGAGFQRATRVAFRLSANPAKQLFLTAAQFKVAADGQRVTIAKAPDLSSLVPPHTKGPFTFDIAVDVNGAENPPTAASNYQTSSQGS
jgi:hypothetical protein